MPQRPIGIFDSGLGGVSVLKEALKWLPNENFIYFGDSKNVPYGEKTQQEIERLSFACADFLVDRGVKVIVVACNTATGAAIRDIREHFSLPVISVEPAIKPACEHKGDGKVLMMATPVTISLERYQALQQRMPDPDRVINVACPGLADRVEKYVGEADKFEELLEAYLGRYRGLKIDGIVLGCTHYIFIKNVITEYAKRNFSGSCRLYDGNEGTVKQIKHVLEENGLLNSNGDRHVEFYTSGEREKIVPLFEKLIRV